ncbi:hypothetical protein [Streptomyces sp. cmx-18-6]|uniref:hypothetical protein n=1 Tax=Streptomyces sp. cmx-18-6 TaxID=2790930 RepID=UPI00398029B9
MADIEELLTDAPVRLAPAAAIRARGERRGARRRTTVAAVAVVAVGALGFGVWTDQVPLQEKGTGRTDVATQSPSPRVDRTEAAPQGPNPYLSGGVVQILEPSELPGYEALRWRSVDSTTDELDEDALHQVGLDGACEGWFDGAEDPEQLFTRVYTGKDGARARHRIAEYTTRAAAVKAMGELDATIVNCGVKRAKGKADGAYAGVSRHTSARLAVTVESWGAWVSVTETQQRPVKTVD